VSAPGVATSRIEAFGIGTRVLQVGDPGLEEAVVLLHGAPGSADDWADLLPRIGAFGRGVAFDLPGFGEAGKPADWGYTPDGFALFIAAALDALGIARAHLVMIDIGGLGCLWAAAHPNSLASAVLIDGGVLIDYRWHLPARAHRLPLVGVLVAASAGLGFDAAYRLYDPGVPKEVRRRWRRAYGWPTRRAMLRLYRATPPSSFGRPAAALRRLDRPALVIWGSRDRFVGVEQAERQRTSFPSAEVVVLDGCGHYPPVEAPQRVAELAVPFLKRQLDRAATG
jgi:pimeloyl-ACP methyl ester carboxylesterase